jgi:hypothetical protein
MSTKQLRTMILQELPVLMQSDTAFREAVLSISRSHFADKLETENRFDTMIERLERSEEKHHKEHLKLMSALQDMEQRLSQKIEEDRKKWEQNAKRWDRNDKCWEENAKRWDRNDKRWEENEKRWDRNDKRWEENTKRWEENEKRWDRNDKRWEQNEKRWEENQRQWEENRQQWAKAQKHLEKHDLQMSKFDQRLMAMGARWGTDSEEAFRNGLAGILKEFPDVQVLHVDEHDDEGVVFGYPEEIELDLIIKNGVLIIGDIKSSIHKSDVYTFARKIRFYEQKKSQQATRKIIISPMINKYAVPVAKKLGIELYSFAEEVNL